MPYSIWGEVWPALIYIFIYRERERERDTPPGILYTVFIFIISIYYLYIISVLAAAKLGFGSYIQYTIYYVIYLIYYILYIIHYALYVIYSIMYTINTNTHKHKPEHNYSRNPRPWSLGCHQQTGSQKKKLGQ